MKLAVKLRPFVLFVAVSLLLAACGSNSKPAVSGRPAVASPATVAAPAPTGSITVYTAGPDGLQKDLVAAFTAATGVQVNVFSSDTGSVLAKLDAEKANPHADVVILADWSGGLGLESEGLLLPYTPRNAEKVPAAYRDPQNQFIAQGISALGIVYNSKVVKTLPTSVAELTGPDWKNKVTMPDPAQSGSVYGIVSAELQKQGDSNGWAFFDSLRKNGLQVLGTNAKALEPVLSGSKSAVLGAADYIALQDIAQGESLQVVYPADGTVLAPRPMMIMKAAPNPVAAKAFEDFMLSDAGQKLVAKQLILPARSDIPADPSRQPLEAIHALPVNWTQAIAGQTDALTRFANEITH